MTPLPLTPAANFWKNALESPKKWMVFCEIQVPKTPDPQMYRLTNHEEPTNFLKDSSGVALLFSPFPFEFRPAKVDSEGTLEEATLALGNADLQIMADIEAFDMTGQPVFVYLVHEDDLLTDTPTLREEFEVKTIEAGDESVIAELGVPNLLEREFPALLAMRDHCPVQYKGLLCGYVGTLPKCDKTIFGNNGCKVHGDDEVAAGDPRQHPGRFGGKLGMQKP